MVFSAVVLMMIAWRPVLGAVVQNTNSDSTSGINQPSHNMKRDEIAGNGGTVIGGSGSANGGGVIVSGAGVGDGGNEIAGNGGTVIGGSGSRTAITTSSNS
ncbi:hypothetical protein C8R47DRAFT_1165914 [Mycena vitilis]|nr:hypothetical protein C8R47DRAFT_1165914 [Mycena vitilis]